MDIEAIVFLLKYFQYLCVFATVYAFVRNPAYGFAWFYFFLPIWSFGSITSNYYAGIYLDFINIVPRTFAVGLIFLFSLPYALKKETFKLPMLLICLSFFGFLSILSNGLPNISVLLFLHGLIEPLLLVLAMRFTLTRKSDLRPILGGLVAGATAGVVLGILLLAHKIVHKNLLDALFGWDNPIAQVYGGIPFLIPQFCIILPLLICSENQGCLPGWVAKYKTPFTLLFMTALLLTIKRGPLLVFAILSLLIVVKTYRILSLKKYMIAIGTIGLLIIALYNPLVDIVTHFTSIMFTPRSKIRLHLYKNVPKIIDGKYFFGIGLGRYRDPEVLTAEGKPFDSPHNMVLHIMSENGLLFLFTFLIYLITMLYKYYYFSKSDYNIKYAKQLWGITFGIGLFCVYSIIVEGEIIHAYYFNLAQRSVVGVKNSGILVVMFFYGVLTLFSVPGEKSFFGKFLTTTMGKTVRA